MDRMKKLEEMVEGGSKDPFITYALGLEYRAVGDLAKASELLKRTREIDTEYLPLYYQLAECLILQNQSQEAKEVLEAGIALAQKQAALKARSELQSLLDSLEG